MPVAVAVAFLVGLLLQEVRVEAERAAPHLLFLPGTVRTGWVEAAVAQAVMGRWQVTAAREL